MFLCIMTFINMLLINIVWRKIFTTMSTCYTIFWILLIFWSLFIFVITMISKFVTIQSTLLSKSHFTITYCAFIRFLSCMNTTMLLKNFFTLKSRCSLFSFEGSFFGVRSPMYLQRCAIFKSFMSEFAWFLYKGVTSFFIFLFLTIAKILLQHI